MAKTNDGDRDWDFHLRTISAIARDSSSASDPASNPSLLPSVRNSQNISFSSPHSRFLLVRPIRFPSLFLSLQVKKLYEMCKAGNSDDLVARIYPQLNKLFQRSIASLSQTRTSNGLLLLPADFFSLVLESVCIPIEMKEPILLKYFYSEVISKYSILESCGCSEFADPVVAEATLILVVALEKVERSSGSLIGSSIASIQKSTAPEMLLALMDEAYTGSTIEDRGGDSGSDDNSTIDVADSLFLDLLKDENDGLAERQWTSPGTATVLQAAINSPHSDRLKQAIHMAPRFLDIYFAIALKDVQRRILEFMLAAFQRCPHFVAVLKDESA
ncbi:hypothetical protein ACLOJK_029475 [Asimina triloba]